MVSILEFLSIINLYTTITITANRCLVHLYSKDDICLIIIHDMLTWCLMSWSIFSQHVSNGICVFISIRSNAKIKLGGCQQGVKQYIMEQRDPESRMSLLWNVHHLFLCGLDSFPKIVWRGWYIWQRRGICRGNTISLVACTSLCFQFSFQYNVLENDSSSKFNLSQFICPSYVENENSLQLD